jgi:hypothetical protein
VNNRSESFENTSISKVAFTYVWSYNLLPSLLRISVFFQFPISLLEEEFCAKLWIARKRKMKKMDGFIVTGEKFTLIKYVFR